MKKKPLSHMQAIKTQTSMFIRTDQFLHCQFRESLDTLKYIHRGVL